MKRRPALASLLLLAISHSLHAETIHGLCRATDSFELFPIALDTDTGVATPTLKLKAVYGSRTSGFSPMDAATTILFTDPVLGK